MHPLKRWYAESTNCERRRGGPGDVRRRRGPVHRPLGPGVIEAARPRPHERRRDGVRDGEPRARGDARGGRRARADRRHRAAPTTRTRSTTCCASPDSSAVRWTRAPTAITEEMKLAAAYGIAEVISPSELSEDYIIPSVFDRRVAEAVAQGGRATRRAAPASRARRRPPRSPRPRACRRPAPSALGLSGRRVPRRAAAPRTRGVRPARGTRRCVERRVAVVVDREACPTALSKFVVASVSSTTRSRSAASFAGAVRSRRAAASSPRARTRRSGPARSPNSRR